MARTYSYFDQFNDYTVNLTEYLTRFNIEFSNKQPIVVTMKNIFERIKIIDEFKLNATFFTKYTISDDEQIYNTAFNTYGSTDYWWVIAIFNDIKNPFFDWVLTAEQLNNLAYKLSTTEKKYSKDTYYELLFVANEAKRNITLPTIAVLPTIMYELSKNFANQTLANR